MTRFLYPESRQIKVAEGKAIFCEISLSDVKNKEWNLQQKSYRAQGSIKKTINNPYGTGLWIYFTEQWPPIITTIENIESKLGMKEYTEG